MSAINMGSQSTIIHSDISLLPFLKALNDAESEERLAFIVEEIAPTIGNIIKSKLRVSLNINDNSRPNQDALEIIGDVQAALVSHLRNLKSQNGEADITDFKSYAATIAFNACHQYLRQKYPVRTQLKYKLRYLLTHQQNFALWQHDEGEFVCGFRKWQFEAKEPPSSIPNLENLKKSLASKVSRNKGTSDRVFYTELLSKIFDQIKAPVNFDILVSFIIELLGIKEKTEVSETEDEKGNNYYEQIADNRQRLPEEFERRERLVKLWGEICLLPLRHRAALLLNLKDKGGECVITYLPLLRIATIAQIAKTLDFKPEDFAAVWNDLPWDDLKIAEHLGVTRQQVINLRQSARARLLRTDQEH